MSREPERLSDEELVRRARDGDARAVEILVRRYLRPTLAVALEFAPRREDAEDVVQEAFHRALRQLGHFDDRLSFRPWFFTIVRNLGRNLAAQQTRWRSVPVPEALAAPAPSPLVEAQRAEMQEQLSAAVERLPEMQRACFRLCDMEGFSGREVAEMLGVTVGTVRTHVHRARRALRQTLRSFGEESGFDNDD